MPTARVLTGPGPPATLPAYGTGMQCLAQEGWSISANGEALTCAARWGTPGEQASASLRSAQCPAKTGTGQVNLGFPDGSTGCRPAGAAEARSPSRCTADTPGDAHPVD